jgi:hypothetical protein
MDREKLRFVVLVKAAPVLTRQLDETMCVAGVRTGKAGVEWVRLHPVPFRDLDDDSRFAKYQTVEVDVIRSKTDRRPESWSPIHGSIVLGKTMDTSAGWRRRRNLLGQLPELGMCDLIEANRRGSGPGVPSLAVVRPVEPPRLVITERGQEQVDEWRRRAVAAEARVSLFDDPSAKKAPFEVVPWRFQYEFRCSAPECIGKHTQTIVDWEILALWRRVRGEPDWKERMRRRFEDDMWKGKDSVLFVGNQEQHPISFLVLGVFWPPAGPVQTMLDI